MPMKFFRRILDSIAKGAGQDNISVEVFVSDNGDPLFLTTLMKLPERRIMEARVETLRENVSGVSEYFPQDLSALRGIEAKEGYLKKLHEALHDQEIPKLLFDALVENARICFQLANHRTEGIGRFDFTDTFDMIQLEYLTWPDSPGKCIPFSERIQNELKTHKIRANNRLDLWAPLSGQNYRFRRDKVMECHLQEDQHILMIYMCDDKHEIEVKMSISPNDKRVGNIGSRFVRMPFNGICNRPYQQISLLEGAPIDTDFRQRVVTLFGGESGCIHLVDLIMDLVRYHRQVCDVASVESI
jgi:hypothetical protein